MSRKFFLYLSDILEAIERIQNYTHHLSESEFMEQRLVLDACYYNFLVIGEAVKQLPEELRLKSATTPWKSIAGLRDMVAHEYFRVDDQILWDVVQNHLSPLKNAVENLLKTLE